MTRHALTPYLKTLAPVPGAMDMAQARIDRTVLVARSLVAGGMNPLSAANAAAADASGEYKYVDGWRIPASVVGGTRMVPDPTNVLTGFKLTDGAGLARQGAQNMLAGVTAGEQGGYLQPPPTTAGERRQPGPPLRHPGRRQRPLGHRAGRQRPDADDPAPGGTWDKVADKYGRPVRANWSDLSKAIREARRPAPVRQAAAQPADRPLRRAPVPAFSKQQAFNALVRGGERSGKRPGRGQRRRRHRQDAGHAGGPPGPIAQRLFGQPLDLDRLKNDAAYNTQDRQRRLQDGVNHYGPSPGGLALTLAEYYDGRGNVEGYNDAKGYHPGLIQSFGDPRQPGANLDQWVARIASRAPKTSGYVRDVIPRIYAHLTEGR